MNGMNEISKQTKIIIVVVAVLLLITALILLNLRSDDKILPDIFGVNNIEYDGHTYKLLSNRVNVLLIGIDDDGVAKSSGSFMNRGLADFICLLSLDIKTKECYAIHINRDTITDISTYGVGGAYMGKITKQIALSHQYGDGLNESCLNVCSAVKSLLGGVDIDYYMSIRMDAIAKINDFVGGVEVPIEDDFPDPELVEGTTVTLRGEQALTYIRARGSLSDSTNLHRMERQRIYLENFYPKLQEHCATAMDLYEDISPYIVTNCPIKEMQRFIGGASAYKLAALCDLPGTAVVENGVMAYYLDEEKKNGVVVRCLCKMVK